MEIIIKWGYLVASAMKVMGDLSFIRDFKSIVESEKIKKEKFQIKINKKRGLTLFKFGKGEKLWALNVGNSNRKAKNKGWIK